MTHRTPTVRVGVCVRARVRVRARANKTGLGLRAADSLRCAAASPPLVPDASTGCSKPDELSGREQPGSEQLSPRAPHGSRRPARALRAHHSGRDAFLRRRRTEK